MTSSSCTSPREKCFLKSGRALPVCIRVAELKWLSWVSKGWDIRQEKWEEKQKIAAGARCARSKRVQGEDWKSGQR